MDCDKYLELLALRLDGGLTREEAQELEEHLAACPDCRAAGAQLAALQEAFPELEGAQAPEGFTQGVMDRVRAEARSKVIPLFKRPQVRALAGLAACLVLAAGLYGVARGQNQEKLMLMNRSFQHDVFVEEQGGAPVYGFAGAQSAGGGEDSPQITAYAAPSPAQADVSVGTEAMEKSAGEPAADGSVEYGGVLLEADAVLVLDRLPNGAAELIPPNAAVSHDSETGVDIYTWLTAEELAAVEALAFEQGLLSGTAGSEPPAERCALVVRNK